MSLSHYAGKFIYCHDAEQLEKLLEIHHYLKNSLNSCACENALEKGVKEQIQEAENLFQVLHPVISDLVKEVKEKYKIK